MNFFEKQEQARKKTLLLMLFFLLAILTTLLLVNLSCYFALLIGSQSQRYSVSPPTLASWLTSPASHIVNAVLLGSIAVGSLQQFFKLRKGGRSVALMAGGVPVALDTREPQQRILINVVEEMAIAAGLPVPTLYLLPHEQGINAFVAGYEANEAVLAVTQGLTEQLTREEMQGVIAHEFSHILNGDMRINLQLIALLGGLMLLGDAGRFLMRSTRHTDSTKGALASVVAGLILSTIGYVGLLSGRMIKAAIVRQREFLADASAVQFTRNTGGIAGALYKIAKSSQSAFLSNSMYAETINHLCFSESLKVQWQKIMASHPPIEERINAIDKSLLTRFKAREYKSARESLASEGVQLGAFQAPVPQSLNEAQASAFSGTNANLFLQRTVGCVTPQAITYAQKLLEHIPDTLRQATQTVGAANLLVIGLCATQSHLRNRDLLKDPDLNLSLEEQSAITHYAVELSALGSKYRFPVIELALPALKQLAAEDRLLLLSKLRLMMHKDKIFALSEYLVLALLTRHLHPDAEKPLPVRYRTLQAIQTETEIVMAILCSFNASERTAQQALFEKILQPFFTPPCWPQSHEITPKQFHGCLKKLRQVTPFLKSQILSACAECVLSDGKIQPTEYELLRVIADTLDCPMPPLSA